MGAPDPDRPPTLAPDAQGEATDAAPAPPADLGARCFRRGDRRRARTARLMRRSAAPRRTAPATPAPALPMRCRQLPRAQRVLRARRLADRRARP
jgi:hypothetical protein